MYRYWQNERLIPTLTANVSWRSKLVEVMSSLTADDAVIIDPSDSILDGSPVQVVEPTQKARERF